MGEGLNTEVSSQDCVAVMAVDGRIDHETATDFQTTLLSVVETGEPNSGYLVLDFAKVNYISSVGLRALMLAAKASKSQGGVLAVAAYTTEVGEIFQIARFGFVVKLFDDLADAIHAVSTLSKDN